VKLDRRGFLTGLIVAPAIVRVSSLMAMPRPYRPPFLLEADGRLVCNGALLRAADFPELFSVMGNSFGGDGSHFRLPDLTSCLPSGGVFPFRYLVNSAPLGALGPVGTLMLSR
jgi:hypothetical protein